MLAVLIYDKLFTDVPEFVWVESYVECRVNVFWVITNTLTLLSHVTKQFFITILDKPINSPTVNI